MKAHPTRELPPDYVPFWQFDLSKVRELFWLNFFGLVLLFASLISFGFMVYHLRVADFPIQFTYHREPPLKMLLFLVELFVVTGIMVVVHEAFHGIFFWIITRTRPVFAFKLYYASASAPGWYIPRGPYFVTALAPLVGITALCVLGIAFLPAWWITPLYLMLIFNTSGAVGDIWVVLRLLFSPRETLICDGGASITFYKPQKTV